MSHADDLREGVGEILRDIAAEHVVLARLHQRLADLIVRAPVTLMGFAAHVDAKPISTACPGYWRTSEEDDDCYECGKKPQHHGVETAERGPAKGSEAASDGNERKAGGAAEGGAGGVCKLDPSRGDAVRERATCSVCGEPFSVTKAGRMRKHLGPGGIIYCRDDVGMSPKPAATPLPGLVEEAQGLS